MDIPLHSEDNGRHIELRVGDLLCVNLVENPTTGYRWGSSALSPSLEMVADSFKPAVGGIGAAGSREFRLLAKEAGEFLLEFFLFRVWEGAGSKIESFTVSGTIR